jgi:hypothetical protein
VQLLSVETFFESNTVIIFRSLRKGDLDTAQRLYDYLKESRLIEGMRLEMREISSKAELMHHLREIILLAGQGMKPILHFETHGCQEKGIEVARTGEWVSWEELIRCLRPINCLSGGNLGVVIAACYGFYALSEVSILEPAPFHVLVGPTEEVRAGYVDDEFRALYQRLLKSSSFADAVKGLGERIEVFHAEKHFTVAITKYFMAYCMGAGGVRRREELLTKGVSLTGRSDRESLGRMRRLAKQHTKPSKETFEKMASKFLVDTSRYSVTFEHVMEMADKLRQRT